MEEVDSHEADRLGHNAVLVDQDRSSSAAAAEEVLVSASAAAYPTARIVARSLAVLRAAVSDLCYQV